MKIILLKFLLIVSFGDGIIACQCTYFTQKFIDDLNHSDFIAIVEIVERDTLKSHQYECNFTRSRIIKQLKGPNINHEVFIVEGHPFSCDKNLSYAIGKTLLIKSRLESRIVWEYSWKKRGIKEGKRSKVLVLSICEEGVLSIENETVIGYMTVDHLQTKSDDNEYSINEIQRLPLQRVIRIIKIIKRYGILRLNELHEWS